jgi:hypothetical protein
MKRRITRKQKSLNTKTEENSETNSIKMQIDKGEQYVEQENIQLEEDHIMKDESLEPEPLLHSEFITDSPDLEDETPRKDMKKSKDESNFEEGSQHTEENNEKLEALKSEDDDDISEEGGNSIHSKIIIPLFS